MSGKVFLIGAGPGDPDLLTIKGKKALQRADVVLFDHLTHSNLLQYCDPTCNRINVGKKKGCHSKKQSQINRLMRSNAQKGLTVARLKGGDPTIFGRAGEEMQYLSKHSIPFEIIPGVTSAIAAPAYAGIPLTHRNLSRSVAFVTGTLKTGEGLGANHLPKADTLVFLMAISHLAKLTDQLIQLKRFKPDTPAALIYKGTTADQAVIISTLSQIAKEQQKSRITSPATLVVGKVVKLASELSWTHQLPLFGQRFVVLRTLAQSKELVNRLGSLGAEVVQFPVLEIRPNRQSKKRVSASFLDPFNAIIFTSPNGITQFMEALFENGADCRSLAGKKIISIGPKTAETLTSFGIKPDEIATESYQEGLLKQLSGTLADRKVLIVTAQDARDVLAQGLKTNGAKVTTIRLYKTIRPEEKPIILQDGDNIIFTSASTVTHFFKSGTYQNEKLTAYALGPITKKALKTIFSGEIISAKNATIDELVVAILNHN